MLVVFSDKIEVFWKLTSANTPDFTKILNVYVKLGITLNRNLKIKLHSVARHGECLAICNKLLINSDF